MARGRLVACVLLALLALISNSDTYSTFEKPVRSLDCPDGTEFVVCDDPCLGVPCAYGQICKASYCDGCSYKCVTPAASPPKPPPPPPPAAAASLAGGPGASAAGACSAGSVYNVRMRACKACTAGTFADQTQQACVTCPPGHVSGKAAAECAPCAAGTIAPLRGMGKCVPCPPFFTSARGAAECAPAVKARAAG